MTMIAAQIRYVIFFYKKHIHTMRKKRIKNKSLCPLCKFCKIMLEKMMKKMYKRKKCCLFMIKKKMFHSKIPLNTQFCTSFSKYI